MTILTTAIDSTHRTAIYRDIRLTDVGNMGFCIALSGDVLFVILVSTKPYSTLTTSKDITGITCIITFCFCSDFSRTRDIHRSLTTFFIDIINFQRFNELKLIGPTETEVIEVSLGSWRIMLNGTDI